MKMKRSILTVAGVLIAVTVVLSAGKAAVFAGENTAGQSTGKSAGQSETLALQGNTATGETAPLSGYVHDPMKNPDAAKDIVRDTNAVYGFSPDPESTRLGDYAKLDWTDPDLVAAMRKEREEYHNSMQELYQMIDDMKGEEKSTEEIARAVSTRRNELRLEAYKDDPEGLAAVKANNLKTYGNENGPTPESLFQKYGSWAMVMYKALSANPGADACLGLYDEYYHTYVVWSGDGNYYELGGLIFDKEGDQASGLTQIDGAWYLFAGGVRQTGFIKVGGSRRYFGPDGVMVTGLKTIGGIRYFFDKNGRMKTGAVKTGGKLYYFQKSGKGRKAKGWFKGFDKKKRYSLGNGRIAAGIKKVGKSYYFFRAGTGTLRKKGFFKTGKKEYYSKGGGKLATGWQAIGKQACYFYKSGKKAGVMAKNTKIGHLKIPKSGRLGEAYALGIKTLNARGWTLRSAYTFSYKLKYYDRWYRTSSSEKYSLRGFKAHHGNCYVMAATFYIQAKLLGYDIHQVRGHVGIWPHSWTVIRHGKKYYVYDPNFRNETGHNGWKIWYGKHGTWRYSGKHWMN